MGFIFMVFVPCYSYYAWSKKNSLTIGGETFKRHYSVIIGFVLLVIATQFLNYMIGIIYIINIVMGLVISTLVLMIVIAANPIIEEAIKKSTIMKTEAKKYVFYWLLFICLLGTFVLVVFAGEEIFLDIDWIMNFLACEKYQNGQKVVYRYDEIIGPWFNFIQTSTLLAWIGGVFGISETFRKITNI
jgi:hypothetical protein